MCGRCGGAWVAKACVELSKQQLLLLGNRTQAPDRERTQGKTDRRPDGCCAPGKRRGKIAGCCGESEKSCWKKENLINVGWGGVKNRDKAGEEISGW